MTRTQFRWTKYRRAIRALLEVGESATLVYTVIRRRRMKAAQTQGWRRSELACTLANDAEEINEVARRLGLPEIKEPSDG